jgi:hypothetical protein
MKRAVQVQIRSQAVINTRTSEPTERPDLGSPWSVTTPNELRYAELAHLTMYFNLRVLRLTQGVNPVAVVVSNMHGIRPSVHGRKKEGVSIYYIVMGSRIALRLALGCRRRH